MLIDRQCEENVIHLVYPLRKRAAKGSAKEEVNSFEKPEHWKRLYQFNHSEPATDEETQSTTKKDSVTNFKDYYSNKNSDNNMIPEEQVVKYFHPSIHSILFSEDNSGKKNNSKDAGTHNVMRAYRINRESERITAKWKSNNKLKQFDFEWLCSEVYMFSTVHFLVIRITMLTDIGMRTLQDWTEFTSLIRMNYPKYAAQERLSIDKDKLFYDRIKALMEEDEGLQEFVIASRSTSMGEEGHSKTPLEEPMAFVHGFATSISHNRSMDLSEIYQVMNLDESPHKPYIDTFEEELINQCLYARWKNQGTYYMAVDYAAMTVHSFSHDQVAMRYLYQHHCSIYLILVLLQLSYREELQNILHLFSQLSLKNDDAYQKAKELLHSYYDLNQYFIFERLTNEIQGAEMWRFYERCLGTRPLYEAVKHDMGELNQRLIEYQNEKQTVSNKQQEYTIYILTIVSGFAGILGMNRLIAEDAGEGLWGFLSWTPYVSGVRALAATLIMGLIFIYLRGSGKKGRDQDSRRGKRIRAGRWPAIIIFFIFFVLDLVLS